MKKTLLLLVFLFSMFTVVGCQELATEVKLSVESEYLTLTVGDEYSVLPQVAGLSVSPQFNFTSSNALVFVVSSSGVITAKEDGIAFLYVSLLNGNAAQLKLTIEVLPLEEGPAVVDPIDEDPIVVDPEDLELLIANGDLNIEVGEIENLEILGNGYPYTGIVSWVSTNPNVVTVDQSGKLTAVAAGFAIISAASEGKFTTITINVREEQVVSPKPTSLILDGTSFVNVSSKVIIRVTADQPLTSTVLWESSDESKATVNTIGVVTGVSSGVVIITAKLADDETVKGTFTLFVKEPNSIGDTVDTITLSGPSEVLVGNKIKLIAAHTPSTAMANFTYSSSNTGVATVDQNGWVTGVVGGSATITATLIGDNSKKSSFSVNIIPIPNNLTISGASTVSYGQNTLLTATIAPLGANDTVIWTTSNSNIATVDTMGRVTGIALGSATITATSTVNSSIKNIHLITVTDQKSITLNPTTLSLSVGNNQTIASVVIAASLTDKSIVWSSGNTAIATVDQFGKVTAVAVGSTTIVAKLKADNSIQAQASITITAALLPTISLAPTTVSVSVAENKTIVATVKNTTNTTVTWVSSNTAIATVSTSGVVTGKAAGSATITATSAANTAVKATCVVTVTAAATLPVLAVSPASGSIYIGEAFPITATVTNSTNTSVTWVSNNTAIATVSTTGVVTGKAAGSTTITVTCAANTSVKKTVAITVKARPAGTIVLSASPAAALKVGATGYQIYVDTTAGASLSRLDCTFITSNASVATVSSYGTISALKIGSVIITAIHSKGTGTIALAVVASTGVTGLVGTYNQGSTIATNNLGYGVQHIRYNGTTKWVSSGTLAPQRVSVVTMDTSRRAKIVMWTKFASASSWQYNTVATLAANYEASNTSWKVLAAANADFYDISSRGDLRYQTMGSLVVAGNTYKSLVTKTTDYVTPGSNAAYKTLGFPNDGSANSIIQGTPTKALTLKVYNSAGALVKSFPVNGINANPGSGAINVFYALYNASHAAVAKAVSKPASGKLMVVGTGTRVLANSNIDFYGNGKVTNANASSATLGANQFAIASNNAELNALVANNYTLRVEYVFSGAFAGIKDATNATRGFILNSAAVDAATCIASRSDIGDRHPRTMIGKKADGTIVIVAADGRQTNMSGVRVEEMQAIMAKYGCSDAFNLDGGGSTRLMIRSGSAYGTTASFVSANSPSENRSVTTVVLIVAPR